MCATWHKAFTKRRGISLPFTEGSSKNGETHMIIKGQIIDLGQEIYTGHAGISGTC